MKVLITGASGLIGRSLTKELSKREIEYVTLTTSSDKVDDIKHFSWDPEQELISEIAFDGVTHIVHLAGAGIADERWTLERKQIIRESRIKSARLIHEIVVKREMKLNAFISASGIGYYGARTLAQPFTESDGPGADFISQVVIDWEKAADEFKEMCRVVKLRTGFVIAPNGGGLEKMIKPIRLGFGSAIGSGKQYIPWIHIDDVVNIYIQALLDKEYEGVFNVVAPESPTNKKFLKTVAKVLRKPFIMPRVPKFLLKWLFGELSVLIIEGSPVTPDHLIGEGYEYKFPDLKPALEDVLKDN